MASSNRITVADLKRWAQPVSAAALEEAEDIRLKVDERLRETATQLEWDLRVSLHGSLANDTTVAGSGDVDIAVTRTDMVVDAPLPSSLAAEAEDAFEELSNALMLEFPVGSVGLFALRVPDFARPTDIVACLRFRDAPNEAVVIVPGQRYLGPVANYPALHLQRTNDKDARTDGMYRQVVRVVKALRNLREDLTGYPGPRSFLLESLVFAVPDDELRGTLRQSTAAALDWIERRLREENAGEIIFDVSGRQPLLAPWQPWSRKETRGEVIALENLFRSNDPW